MNDAIPQVLIPFDRKKALTIPQAAAIAGRQSSTAMAYDCTPAIIFGIGYAQTGLPPTQKKPPEPSGRPSPDR